MEQVKSNTKADPEKIQNCTSEQKADKESVFLEGIQNWQTICGKIADNVEAFCKKHKIERTLPVDIEEIARARKLEVLYTDLNPVEAVNTFAIVGNTLEWKPIKGKTRKIITLDKYQDKNSQRYALAYEIGISMLSELIGEENVPKSYNYSVPILPMNPKKFLAEVYAMCLLLPWKSLLDVLDEYVKDGSHASPIDNIEWIDYLADCVKMPRYNLCIGFSYISKIICMKCQEDQKLAIKYYQILQQ